MFTAARDDQFTLRGTFAERLTLTGSRTSVYRFLADAETLLPLVPGVDRIVAHGDGAFRLVFAPVGAGGLQFTLELELGVSGDGTRNVILQSVPTDIPPLEPKGALGDFTAVLTLNESGDETTIDGNASLSVIDTIPPVLRRLPRMLLEKTTSLAVGKQMETIGRDLMRNVAAAYPDWRRNHSDA
jgi:carbon monoxide dehydrogenase subunit G